MFNIDGGYLEGLCRGFKCGILKQSDYLNLVQCETLEGKKWNMLNIFVIKSRYKLGVYKKIIDLDFITIFLNSS